MHPKKLKLIGSVKSIYLTLIYNLKDMFESPSPSMIGAQIICMDYQMMGEECT